MKIIESHGILDKYLIASLKEMSRRFGNEFSTLEPVATDVGIDSEVDLACMDFASTGEWTPDISFHVFVQCYTRLFQATEFLEFVVDGASNPTLIESSYEMDDEKFLKWLLIDYWYYGGKYRAYLSGKKQTFDQN